MCIYFWKISIILFVISHNSRKRSNLALKYLSCILFIFPFKFSLKLYSIPSFLLYFYNIFSLNGCSFFVSLSFYKLFVLQANYDNQRKCSVLVYFRLNLQVFYIFIQFLVIFFFLFFGNNLNRKWKETINIVISFLLKFYKILKSWPVFMLRPCYYYFLFYL